MNPKKFKIAIQTEADASFLYQCIAAGTKDDMIASYYRQMAEIENHHLQKMLEKGITTGYLTEIPKPSLRARILNRIGKIFGYGIISSMMIDTEKSISSSVLQKKINAGEQIQGNETRHVSILKSLDQLSGESLAKIEGRHRNIGGNALRAAVLGANDGLVSNLSLVMGVVGAAPGENIILIAGVAGLLAGAISMALGEWISVKSSQELYERQINLELEEIENSPEEEMQELALMYKARGMPVDQANEMAKKVISNPKIAQETLVREELAINPEEMKGSAWVASIASFLMFALGAVIPVLAFFWFSGMRAIISSILFSMVGLFLIGAAITLFTGKSIWFSGIRQMIFGLLAAAITYGIGSLIGMSIAG